MFVLAYFLLFHQGNETVEWAMSMPQLVQGKILEVSRGVTCREVRRPLGVCVSVSDLFTGVRVCLCVWVWFGGVSCHLGWYSFWVNSPQIVPFNFPAMVPHWTLPICIAAGMWVCSFGIVSGPHRPSLLFLARQLSDCQTIGESTTHNAQVT